MSKHTPAPWVVGSNCGIVKTEILANNYSRGIATVWTKEAVKGKRDTYERWPEGEANAKLIAAAPELLASCKELLDVISDKILSQKPFPISILGKAEQAIKKAE